MKKALRELAVQICDMPEPPEITDTQWDNFKNKTVVALMSGGVGSRLNIPGKEHKQKNALDLPNGDTMIEMTIRQYSDAGIKKFVILAFHNAHSIEEVVGNGSSMGVEVLYSYDPEQQVGKGGAIRNALDNGSIPEDHYLIVHNPDDVIVDFPGSFPRYIASGHLQGEANGAIASVVSAPTRPYAFSGMKVVGNKVVEIEMYPDIPVPAHIGVTIFSPVVFDRFRELFDLTKKNDFESVLFPILSSEDKLWATGLHSGEWIAVNDLKAYNTLCKYIKEGKG